MSESLLAIIPFILSFEDEITEISDNRNNEMPLRHILYPESKYRQTEGIGPDRTLTRELEYIKQMRRAGELSAKQGRDLRDDVYIQQLMVE